MKLTFSNRWTYRISIAVVIQISIFIIFKLINYIENEGFNPSDDGWILAQAYQIFQGKVPHLDYISLRPAGSAIFHSLHFFSSIPLVISTRWFLLIQVWISALILVICVWQVFNIQFPSKIKDYTLFSIFVLIVFLLNLGNFIIYPWTTTDGLFFAILALPFFIFNDMTSINWKFHIKIFIGIFLLICAMLCRQSFVFTAIFGYIAVILFYFHKRKIFIGITLLTAGLLPFIAYLWWMYENGAVVQFFEQMSRRNEFFDTAILRFAKSFVKSRLVIFYIGVYILLLYGFVQSNFSLKKLSKHIQFLFALHKPIFTGIFIIFGTYVISLFFHLFLIEDRMFQDIPFEMFWAFVFTSLSFIILQRIKGLQRLFLLFCLILAWVSSISLGANSPVFVTGLLAINILVMLRFLVLKCNFWVSQFQKYEVKFSILVATSLFLVSIYGQRNMNYRQPSSSKLTCDLGKIYTDFGHIKTDSLTFAYYTELKTIITQNKLQNNFGMIPCNPIIYPLSRSNNYLPVDWMDRFEYIRFEDNFHERLKKVFRRKNFVFIVDRYDVKQFSEGLKPIDIATIKMDHYNELKYDYWPMIIENCSELPVNSFYFRLFIVK